MAAVRPTPGAAANAPNSAQEVFYLHTDHLGTPRVALDTAGRVRWRWMGGEPFGLSPAENAPTSGLSELNISLRLPGQQYDGFVGLHYNYFRDYDPTMGRYVQSDPIGLAGGINTYAYVGGNPLRYSDPTGQIALIDDVVIGGTVLIVGCAITPACRDWVKNQLRPKPMVSSPPEDEGKSWPTFPPFRPTHTPDADKEARDKCQAAYEVQIEVCKMTSSTPKAREACYARAANQYGECIRKNCR